MNTTGQQDERKANGRMSGNCLVFNGHHLCIAPYGEEQRYALLKGGAPPATTRHQAALRVLWHLLDLTERKRTARAVDDVFPAELAKKGWSEDAVVRQVPNVRKVLADVMGQADENEWLATTEVGYRLRPEIAIARCHGDHFTPSPAPALPVSPDQPNPPNTPPPVSPSEPSSGRGGGTRASTVPRRHRLVLAASAVAVLVLAGVLGWFLLLRKPVSGAWWDCVSARGEGDAAHGYTLSRITNGGDAACFFTMAGGARFALGTGAVGVRVEPDRRENRAFYGVAIHYYLQGSYVGEVDWIENEDSLAPQFLADVGQFGRQQQCKTPVGRGPCFPADSFRLQFRPLPWTFDRSQGAPSFHFRRIDVAVR